MKRLYEPYHLWEDYQHGMYKITIEDEEALTESAIGVLCNTQLFESTALKVLREWPICCKVNLSISSRNRQAFIGQVACCYLFGIPEYITKYAWRMMTPDQQMKANQVADKIIKEWEEKYLKNY